MTRRSLVLLFLVLLLPFGASGAEEGYAFTTRRPDDSVIAVTEGQRTTFVITSKTGIGAATVTPAKGGWPGEVSIKLKKFTMLEGFHLTAGRFKVEGSLRESGKMTFRLADAAGKFAREGNAGTLEITVEKHEDGLEIKLPAHLLAGATVLEVDWIDAYRN